MKLRTPSSHNIRSGLALLSLAGLALLAVALLGWSGAGAAALGLFQSPPASPVVTPAVSAPAAVQPAPTPAASAGLPMPLWIIIVVAAVIILLILGIILRRRQA